MALHAKLGKTLDRLLKGKVVLRALWVQGQTGTNTSENKSLVQEVPSLKTKLGRMKRNFP